MSPRYRALIQLLRTAEDLWNASRVFFARWDLSPSQFNVLNVLHGHPEGLSQSELSRLLIMHRSNATGLVDRLERRGLVLRQEDPEDRRAYRVVLTPAGSDCLAAIYPHYFEAAERVWADLPADRIDALLADLQDLAHQASAVAALMATRPPATPASGAPPPPPKVTPSAPSKATAGSGGDPSAPPPDSGRPPSRSTARRAAVPRAPGGFESGPGFLRTSDL